MTVGTAGDKSRQYKAALARAAETSMRPLEQDGHPLLIRYGFPSQRQHNEFDDIVSITRMATTIDDGPLSRTNRAETHTMLGTVVVSVWRAGVRDVDQPYDDDGTDYTDGGDDLEKVASDQAYQLLTALEEYLRVTNKTLDGLVLWCRCLSHESDGESDRAVIARGRVVEIDAVFTAKVRIEGPPVSL